TNFHTSRLQAFNPPRLSDPEIDKLLDQAAAMVEEGPRMELYRKIQRMLVESGAGIGLVDQVTIVGTRREVQGFAFNVVTFPVLYVRFITRAVVGDFGRSIFTRRPVSEEIAEQLPSTLELAATAIVIAIVVGLALGLLAAVWHNTWIDRAAMLVALGGVSMPSFWLGLLLIFVFSLQLGWLPATGQGGVSRLLLPAATIGLNYSAVIARLVRSS